MNRPELLAPAGGWSQLTAAIRFGADAVYLGLKQYGMRAHAGNFTPEELKEAVAFAHGHGARVFLTLNIFAYDEDIAPIVDAAHQAAQADVDALIMADPGAVCAVRASLPHMPIHLSTQMSTTNAASARMWHEVLGVKRIVLARELSLQRIRDMRLHLPPTLELEAFVHGAVCMAYSGRCALSRYLTGRDANRGDCAQACRWRYQLVEEKRPGQYYPVEGTENGTQIFSAGDLNMLSHLDELCEAGLTSLKIEGRMKNEYYIATVVGAYRRALDAIAQDRFTPALKDELQQELLKVSHRPYDTGFYYGAPEHPGGQEGFAQTMELCARVLHWQDGVARILLKSKLYIGDPLELMTPAGTFPFPLKSLTTLDGEKLNECGINNTQLIIPLPHAAQPGDLLRGPCRNHPTR